MSEKEVVHRACASAQKDTCDAIGSVIMRKLGGKKIVVCVSM